VILVAAAAAEVVAAAAVVVVIVVVAAAATAASAAAAAVAAAVIVVAAAAAVAAAVAAAAAVVVVVVAAVGLTATDRCYKCIYLELLRDEEPRRLDREAIADHRGVCAVRRAEGVRDVNWKEKTKQISCRHDLIYMYIISLYMYQ